ncbi:type II toxin-antitoxin system prevent-host-death family antitoxin [Treponema sp.]|uniref:type II toxin-antitoxin system prevent-host-death family antitoxin n=1 Tax=Treponema sp. TaxID=166 RepID=UPI0025D095D6|nr:type II toxin-antitoxin system prevent-host-death family antitoxin [Treponema sp.]MBR4322802.1 type II toxin-antitoxin system prevent-host-death family antitoxin [Treponema sp.]
MFVTAAELQKNLTKYIILSETEQILVTENGRVVAMLSNPNQNRIETAKSLFGILSSDVSLEESKDERLSAI